MTAAESRRFLAEAARRLAVKHPDRAAHLNERADWLDRLAAALTEQEADQ